MKTKMAYLIRFAKFTLSVAFMAALYWGAYQVTIYLRTAPRFEVQKFSVLGARRIPESQVLAKSGLESGTNVFRLDLDEARSRVEELDWVRYASVQRVLPDQVVIKIVEREPAGLSRIQGEIYQFDIDGKILDPDRGSGSSFPVLDGLRPGDSDGNFRKVETYRKVLEELGQTSLSEIHITDSGEVSVVSSSDPLFVLLGMTDFRARWIKYLQLKPQIQQQYPEAARVDLRFKNQVIIKMKDDDTGENIVWGVKKNTL
jgi:cell division protein FtsQ